MLSFILEKQFLNWLMMIVYYMYFLSSLGTMIGNTDTIHYLRMTNNVYRFSPTVMFPPDLKRFHGVDERISLKNYEQAVNFYYHVIVNSNKKRIEPAHKHGELWCVILCEILFVYSETSENWNPQNAVTSEIHKQIQTIQKFETYTNPYISETKLLQKEGTSDIYTNPRTDFSLYWMRSHWSYRKYDWNDLKYARIRKHMTQD